MNVIELTELMQDESLKAIEASQRLTVEAVSALSSTVERMVPEQFAPFNVPVVSPKEAVAAGVRFTERFLDLQKDFVAQLGAAWTSAPTRPVAAKRTTGATA